MFSLNGTLKKSGSVGRAMGNETIYWDGLTIISIPLTAESANIVNIVYFKIVEQTFITLTAITFTAFDMF